jgi:hypothetical protein
MTESAEPARPASNVLLTERSDAFARLWRASHTSLRLSLDGKRPAKKSKPFLTAGPLQFEGAALTVLQSWEGGSHVPVAEGKRARRLLEVGVGASASASAGGGELLPCARARVRLPLPGVDVVLRALPRPEAVLKLDAPLFHSGLRLRASLRLPWTNEAFDALMLGQQVPWRPEFSCRLSATPVGSGLLNFSPRGVSMTERSLVLGEDTVLRCAASLDFPDSFPIREGDEFKARVDKLALTTRVRYGKN